MKQNNFFRYQLGLAVFSLALASCGSKENEVFQGAENKNDNNEVVLNQAQFETAQIKFGHVEKRNISNVLFVNGKLDVPPQNLVSISAPFGGFLKQTDLLQGKPVVKGERIAMIENPMYIQLQQDYLEAKNQLEFLSSEYKRQEALVKDNVNAEKTLQQAKASYFSKRAVVSGLHTKLAMLNIDFNQVEQGVITSTVGLYSPISGFVTEVNYNIGSFVSPTDVLFKIVDTSHLHAELVVFEKDIVNIRKGQKVRFTLPGDSLERLATIYLIGRAIAPDRTVRIHCHLDREDKNLLPGMFLNAVIELGANLSNVLPDKAIIDYNGKHYVFIKEGERKFKMIEVIKGHSELGYTAVTLPEPYGNTDVALVVNGAYSLLSKMKNTEEAE